MLARATPLLLTIGNAMRSLKLLAGMLLCLSTMPAVMEAQDISGYTPQETVLVPVTGAPVSSLTTLISGVDYKLRAVGTAQVNVPSTLWWRYQLADAEYAYDPVGLLGFPLEVNRCRFAVDIGIAVNSTANTESKVPAWGAVQLGARLRCGFQGATPQLA